MGKSATAAMFAAHGVPVHDARTRPCTPSTRGRGAAAPRIGEAFPGTLGRTAR